LGGFPVDGLFFTPDGETVLCVTRTGIHRWSTATGKTLPTATTEIGFGESSQFSTDGKLLTGRSDKGPVHFVLAGGSTGEVAHRIAGLSGLEVSANAFAPDGRTVATETGGKGVALWELASGQLRGRLKASDNPARRLAFSPDGKLLATTEMDSNLNVAIGIWSLDEAKLVDQFTVSELMEKSLVFSPDSRLLASAGGCNTALIWDIESLPRGADPKEPLSRSELANLWADLIDPDAVRAYHAVRTLARHPDAAQFLGQSVRKSVGPDGDTIARWIADLDDSRFEVRERASAELAGMGPPAASALQRTLQGSPSLEVRNRVQALLDKLGNPRLDMQELRCLRVVEALEAMACPESRKVLNELAAEAKGPVAEDAKRSVARLARRMAARPGAVR
jgi:hypothetical protein